MTRSCPRDPCPSDQTVPHRPWHHPSAPESHGALSAAPLRLLSGASRARRRPGHHRLLAS